MNSWGRISVFDLETTGVDVDTSRIVSACIAILEPSGAVVARWDWLADPGVEIPEGAAAVHGITTERARLEGRPAPVVVAEIAQTLRVIDGLGIPVVVYNAPYDLTLLDRECRRHKVEPLGEPAVVIDPLVLDKAVDRYRKGKRTLEVTARLYGVALDDAHDAGADAIAAGRVAQALVAAYPSELGVPLADLHRQQVTWYADQAASFQDYIRRVKGDESFVADDAWPQRPIDDISALIDTMPFPRPRPRPSMTVPEVDLDTGRISIGGRAPISAALAAARPPQRAVDGPTPDVARDDPNETSHEQEGATAAPSSSPSAPPGIASAKRPAIERLAVAIITPADGRTVLKRSAESTHYGYIGTPMASGESAIDALTRSLREQYGVEVDLGASEYLGSHRSGTPDDAGVVTRAEVFAVTVIGELVPTVPGDQLALIGIDDLPSIELDPLTRDTIVPLWLARRSALF